MGIKFSNNASTTLASGITSGATSLTVATGTGAQFPSLGAGDYFYATIEEGASREIIRVTARSSDTFTMTRAQEGTTAAAFTTAATIELRPTAAALDAIRSEAVVVSSVNSKFGAVVLGTGDLAETTPTTITTLSDSFTESSTVALASHTPDSGGSWALVSGYAAANVTGGAGTVVGTTTSNSYYEHSVTPSSADVYIEGVFTRTAASGVAGLTLRSQAAVNTFYYAFADGSGVFLARWSGTGSTLGSSSVLPTGTPFTLRLEAVGNTIRVLVNGTQVISATNSDITVAGKFGFVVTQNSTCTQLSAGSLSSLTANQFYTDARARAAISVTGSGGSYNNSTGVITLTGGGGGLTNFTEGVNTAAPNATIPVVTFAATNAATNVDIALRPKGTGAITVQVPDGTTTGGNKRGDNAIDFGTARTNADQVASGARSFIAGGRYNRASGASSFVCGDGNYADGTYSFAANSGHTVTGNQSAAFGDTNTVGGTTTFAAGRLIQTTGVLTFVTGVSAIDRGVRLARVHGFGSYNHATSYILGRATTDASATDLTADGNAPATGNVIFVDTSQVYSFEVTIAARNTSTNDGAVWKLVGAIKRTSGAPVIMGGVSKTVIARDVGAAGWDVSAVAEATFNSLRIRVTGAAATNIKWLANVQTVEVF